MRLNHIDTYDYLSISERFRAQDVKHSSFACAQTHAEVMHRARRVSFAGSSLRKDQKTIKFHTSYRYETIRVRSVHWSVVAALQSESLLHSLQSWS